MGSRYRHPNIPFAWRATRRSATRKYCDFRALAYVENGSARLVSRNGRTFKTFPELTAAIGPAFGGRNAVLDGEIVHLGPDGKPQFYPLLWRRGPPHIFVFDLLSLDGRDLCSLPLLERKRVRRDRAAPGGVAGADFDYIKQPRPSPYCGGAVFEIVFAMGGVRMGLHGSPAVLVVDDDPEICAFLTALLKKHGHKVFSAESGEQGCAFFEQHHREIDVVLTDVVMPRLTGPQMVKRMVSVKPDLCVIFMSGYNSETVLTEDYAQRFPFLQKPFSHGDVVAAIAKVLGEGPCSAA